jgi:hypothetical protein
LIDQYSNVRDKIAAVMNWRRMSPNQQRDLCAEITASAKDERKLDQCLQKIENGQASQDALWLKELRAARTWQREMDAARAEYESVDPVDSAAVLSALHRINSLMEESVASALKAQNVALNKQGYSGKVVTLKVLHPLVKGSNPGSLKTSLSRARIPLGSKFPEGKV